MNISLSLWNSLQQTGNGILSGMKRKGADYFCKNCPQLFLFTPKNCSWLDVWSAKKLIFEECYFDKVMFHDMVVLLQRWHIKKIIKSFIVCFKSSLSVKCIQLPHCVTQTNSSLLYWSGSENIADIFRYFDMPQWVKWWTDNTDSALCIT